MAAFMRRMMDGLEIRGPKELQVRLAARGVSVHENMISRWTTGAARPQDSNLEALLDLFGLVRAEEREEARRLAYFPPSALDEDVSDLSAAPRDATCGARPAAVVDES